MPITTPLSLPCLSTEEFGRLSYDVLHDVFAIHKQLGRLFDERIYKIELARRIPGAVAEFHIDVTHQTFSKRYFVDLITPTGGVFELKVATGLTDAHRAQLLHYLMLLDLPHGKLINFRGQTVQHEFVNLPLTTAQRRQFILDDQHFLPRSPGASNLHSRLLPLLNDLGAGLESQLYLHALTHLLADEQTVEQDLPVLLPTGQTLATQHLHLCHPTAAFKLTTYPQPPPGFANHCRRFLHHLPLQSLHWINISRHTVTLTTIQK